jgi:hypothetical protein
MRTMRKELNMLTNEEIQPGAGISYLEHAESVARFNLRGVDYNEIQFAAERLRVLQELQPGEELN